jgi:DNA-binding CsgD family transcriptional regulator
MSLVGRDAELELLDRFVREAQSGCSIVLIGSPGIGKTTLWEAAVGSARDRGVRVLAARAGGSGALRSYSGLIDLCDGLSDAELAVLPGPQRRALEAALLRGELEQHPSSAVPVAFLGLVRALRAMAPVLIAIDDLQWLDHASAEAVTFLVRRLDDAPVAFLLARQRGPAGLLESALARSPIQPLEVGPLAFGAVRRLLFERLGLSLSRQRLRQIVDATGGNPLFAIEIGRALREERGEDAGLPLPDSLEEVMSARVARLPPAVRRVLLVVALSEETRTEQLLAVIDAETLDDAVDAGAVVLDGQRVRASHPLLAVAAEKRARSRERREMHLALARIAREEPARALHLALASQGTDATLAVRVAAAAELSRGRGERREAALLASHALRLTPARAPERPARVVDLAGRLDDAGELRRMTALLREELPALPAGPLRARAWLHLSESDDVTSRDDQDRHLERALAESGEDRDLRAYVLAKRAGNAAAAAVSQLAEAEAWAREAIELAKEPSVRRYALWALAWPLGLEGRAFDELCERSGAMSDPSAYLSASPERVAAKRLYWRGEMPSARAALASLLALADERNDLTSYAMLRMHAIEVELRAGNLRTAQRLLDEWGESSDFETQFRPQYPRCLALFEAGRGAAREARGWADKTIELAKKAGSTWDELEARRARGIAALLDGAPDQALIDLTLVWEHCEREGVRELGAFPVAPELVEALLEQDRHGEAVAVSARLHECADEQDHPWARATARRCSALAAFSAGSTDAPAAELQEASAEYELLELHLDSARCLLALGRAKRRSKQWRDARETLEQAASRFDALGASGWAERARAELERVGGRRGSDGELTPSERRVVELAIEGMSNKEIAAALYVTVNTVEVHLGRAYAKLGVRSRAQLAKRMS